MENSMESSKAAIPVGVFLSAWAFEKLNPALYSEVS